MMQTAAEIIISPVIVMDKKRTEYKFKSDHRAAGKETQQEIQFENKKCWVKPLTRRN